MGRGFAQQRVTAAAGAPGEVLLFEDFCGWCAHRHVGAGFADSDEEDIEASAHYKITPAPAPEFGIHIIYTPLRVPLKHDSIV